MCSKDKVFGVLFCKEGDVAAGGFRNFCKKTNQPEKDNNQQCRNSCFQEKYPLSAFLLMEKNESNEDCNQGDFPVSNALQTFKKSSGKKEETTLVA